MFMVMIVAISPAFKWKMRVYSDEFAEEPVERYGREEGKVSHIMELDEETYHVEAV